MSYYELVHDLIGSIIGDNAPYVDFMSSFFGVIFVVLLFAFVMRLLLRVMGVSRK